MPPALLTGHTYRLSCAGGREQHLLTAAAHSLLLLRPDAACLLPNDAQLQTAFFNMGVSNTVDGLRLSAKSGRVENQRGGVIAILHQFDRRAAIHAFIRRHLVQGS